MDVIIRLFVAHAMGDAGLQTTYMASHKAISVLTCFSHAGVVASCFYLLFGVEAFWIQLISHFCIEYVSSRYWIGKVWYGHLLDQSLHAVLCLITYVVIRRKREPKSIL